MVIRASSIRRSSVALVATIGALLASSAVASASVTCSLKIHGPTSVALGKTYHETIVGHISNIHRAYATEMYEQTPAGKPCAKTHDKEIKRLKHSHGSVHALGGEFIMHKSFREVFPRMANAPGKHRFCAYVSRFKNNNLHYHDIARASLEVSYH